jgi:hypothetical protein
MKKLVLATLVAGLLGTSLVYAEEAAQGATAPASESAKPAKSHKKAKKAHKKAKKAEKSAQEAAPAPATK